MTARNPSVRTAGPSGKRSSDNGPPDRSVRCKAAIPLNNNERTHATAPNGTVSYDRNVRSAIPVITNPTHTISAADATGR